MRTWLLTVIMLCAANLGAQTYFYIDQIQVLPAQPTTGDLVSLQLIGGLAGTGVYIVSADAQVVGPNVTVNIVAADNGGLTVIVPYTEQLFLGQLPAGTYTVTINGVNVGDFAPPEQHAFTVSGGGGYPCDSLAIASVEWQAFADTAVMVHAINTSTEIFSYPNFILYDAQGDTLAVETVNFFGIAGDSWHTLDLVDGATMPEGPFQGTLALFTGFGVELACTFTGTWDLCPPAPCSAMTVAMLNQGGALVLGDFAWNIQDSQGSTVGAGVFTLTNDAQFDSAQVCLPPGAYAITVLPLGDPTGGQPVFSVFHESGSVPLQPVTWTPPVPLLFNFFGPCAGGPQAIGEPEAIAMLYAIAGGTLRVWRTDGRPVGPLELIDVTGRVLAQVASATTSEVALPLPAHFAGILLLRSTGGVLRLLAPGN